MEDGASSGVSSMHSGSISDNCGSGKSDARSQAVPVEETESSYRGGKDEPRPERENGSRRPAPEPFKERKGPTVGDSSCSSTNEQFSKRTKRRSRKVQRSVKDDAQRAVKHWTSPRRSDSVALYRWSMSASSDTLQQQQQDLNIKTTDSVRIVAAVLAFQRWRQYQLKKLFNHELRKATREAHQDDKSLANLEQEIANRDLHLARALSDMAQMRAQISSTSRASARDKQLNADDLQKRLVKAQQKANETEHELRKLEAENKRLSQSLKMMEEEARRVDGKLHGAVATLQSEKEGALGEVRVLLDQLARRDEELGSLSEEKDKLRSALIRLADRQASQEKLMETVKLEHKAELKSCNDQLKEAHAAKLAVQMDHASLTERYKVLVRDKESLAQELQRVAEQADFSSRHAKELQDRLNIAAETHAKASEDVAAEMIEHLKTLTEHMKELESTVDKGGHFPISQIRKSLESGFYAGSRTDSCIKQSRIAHSSSGYQQLLSTNREEKYEAQNVRRRGRRAGKQGKRLPPPKVETFENQDFRATRDSPTISSSEVMPRNRHFGSYGNGRIAACSTDMFQPEQDSEEEPPLTTSGKQMILFSDDHPLATMVTQAAEHKAQTVVRGRTEQGPDPPKAMMQRKSWVTWKWKWAVAESKARRLSRQMSEFEEKLGTVLHGRNHIARHKLVPLVLSAWRSYTYMKRLKRRARRSQQSLDGLMAALPWWIRRVGERRRLEKIFSLWQRQTLRSGKRSVVGEKLAGHRDVRSELPSQGVDRTTRSCSPHHVHFGRSRQRASPQGQRRRSPTNVHWRGPTVKNQKGQGFSFFQGYKHATESNVPPKDDIVCEPSRSAAQELALDRGNLSTTTIARALRALQEELRDLRGLVSKEVDNHHQARFEEPGKTGYRHLHRPQLSHMRETASSAKRSLDAVLDVCNDLASALGETGRQLQGFDLGEKATRRNSKSPLAGRKFPIVSGYSTPRKTTAGTVRCLNTGAGTIDQDRSKPDSRPVDCVVQISRDCNVKVEPLPTPEKSPRTTKRASLPRSCARAGALAADEENCMGGQYADLLRSEIFRLKDGHQSGDVNPCVAHHQSLPNAPPQGPPKKPPWSKY